MRVAIYTLGCKVNQYETQAMEQELTARGHELVDFAEPADVYVVNSCSVTAVSDKKSRQMLRRARKQNPNAIVAVCGCYAQTHTEQAKEWKPDVLAGTGDRAGFLDLLEKSYAERQPLVQVDDPMQRRSFEILPPGGMSTRTRAMMKVEDGCVNFCSYCIIPYARGPVRSLPLEVAKRQARQLAEEGYREIVLTGIEISSYGHDFQDGTALIDLLEAVAQSAPAVRLRLGSLEPRTVTEEFCRRASALETLCPHFHLSLQSGCDATLRRMNRKYDTERFLQSVELLREHFPMPAITTDLIVGFPEETEAEFAQTLDFIRRCAFAEMHIFPYSIRPGTPAAKRPQVEGAVKDERAARAAEAAQAMHRSYLQACVGEEFAVLFEQERDGGFVGHAPNYMPVWAKGENLHNRLCTVRIAGVSGDGLRGEITAYLD